MKITKDEKVINTLLRNMSDLPEASSLLYSQLSPGACDELMLKSLTDEAVVNATSDPAPKAVCAVRVSQSPKALAQLARSDDRVRVLEAIVANRNFTGDVVDVVWRKALRKSHSGLISQVSHSVPIQTFVDTADELRRFCDNDGRESFDVYVGRLAARACVRNNLEEIRFGLTQTALEDLPGMIVGKLQRTGGDVSGSMTQEDAMAFLGEHNMRQIVDTAFTMALGDRSKTLSSTLVETFLCHGSWDNLIANGRPTSGIWLFEIGALPEGATLVEQTLQSAEARPDVWRFLLSGAYDFFEELPEDEELPFGGLNPSEVARKVIDAFVADSFTRFAGVNPAAVDLEDEHTGSPALFAGLSHVVANVIHQNFAAFGFELLDELESLDEDVPLPLREEAGKIVTDVLKLMTISLKYDGPELPHLHNIPDHYWPRILDIQPRLVYPWFKGLLGFDPKPGQVAAWVGAEPSASSESRLVFLGGALSSLDPPADGRVWIAEALDLLGVKAMDVLGVAPAAASAVVDAASEAFGDDPQAWRLFWSMRDQIGTRPLTDIVNAVATLTQPDRQTAGWPTLAQ